MLDVLSPSLALARNTGITKFNVRHNHNWLGGPGPLDLGEAMMTLSERRQSSVIDGVLKPRRRRLGTNHSLRISRSAWLSIISPPPPKEVGHPPRC